MNHNIYKILSFLIASALAIPAESFAATAIAAIETKTETTVVSSKKRKNIEPDDNQGFHARARTTVPELISLPPHLKAEAQARWEKTKSFRLAMAAALAITTHSTTAAHEEPKESKEEKRSVGSCTTSIDEEFDKVFKLLDAHIDNVLDQIMRPIYRQPLPLDHGPDCLYGMYPARELPWLNGYFIKNNAQSRIKGAAILQACITKNNLFLICLAPKKIYTVPLTRIERYDTGFIPRELCIAQKINGEQGQTITLKQAKQLCILAKETNFYDLSIANLIFCDDERIVIIDTELRGFIPGHFTGGGYRILCVHSLQPDAKEYIEGKIKELEDSETKKASAISAS